MSTGNVYITKCQVEDILNKISDNEIKINNLFHYQTAFAHKSYIAESHRNLESNERLEFLGDSFLGSVVSKYIIERYPKEQEGFLTKLRTRLVRSAMLYRFARYLGLGKFILLSSHIEKLTNTGSNKGRNNPRLYEDCFEAFVGAIIEDFGDEQGYIYAKRFIIGIMEHLVDFSELITQNENFKDTLQRYFQSFQWKNPIYLDLHESGPSHMKNFVKGVFLKKEYFDQIQDLNVKMSIQEYHNKTLKNHSDAVVANIKLYQDEYIIGISIANKKNVAEQSASRMALCCLNIDENNF
jgi:ribonuclease-3